MTGGSTCEIAVGPAYADYLTDTGSSFKLVRTGLGAPGPIVDTFTATPTGDCGLAFGPDQRLYWTNGGFNSSGTSGLWSVGNEPTSPPPTTTAPGKRKPHACKKGTRRKKVKVKARCLRVKKHKHRHRHRGH
jgi:hypothetical protein